MSDLLAHVPPTRLVPEGHYGLPGAEGVHARALANLAAATLVARKGRTGAVLERLAAAGLPLTDAPKAVIGSAFTAIGTGPGRWLVIAEDMSGAALLAHLEAAAGDDAALTDQSDANIILELSGPKARAALAKGVALDLDPRAFQAGDAATTVISHVGVTLWQVEEAPLYRLAVARSFAPALLRTLTANSAEYGFALTGTGRG